MQDEPALQLRWKEVIWYAWTSASAVIAASGALAYLLGLDGALAVWGL